MSSIVAIGAAVPGPPGPRCQKSLKKVFPGLSGQSAKKVPKKLKKSWKSFFGTFKFRDFSTFSALFWHSGRPFWDFVGILGPEGQTLPVTGRSNRKSDSIGNGKRGHYKRGLFTGGLFRVSKFSRISRKWSGSPLFSTLWGISRSLESLHSLHSPESSRKWTFLKRPLSKDPFSRPRV